MKQFERRFGRFACAIGLFVGAVTVSSLAMAEPEIRGVVVDRLVVDEGGKPIEIRYRVSGGAESWVRIFDARGVLVRELKGVLSPGGQDMVATWDLRDWHGRAVPAEVYHYVIQAAGKEGGHVALDLTDSTGGETVLGENIRYDAVTGRLTYSLPKRARVFVRAGIEGSSVLKTIVNGAVRDAGLHDESWDGRDESGVIDLGRHPKLQIYVEGYRLSDNSIVVRAREKQQPLSSNWLDRDEDRGIAVRRERKARPVGLNVHAYHDPEMCRDARLTLSIVDPLPVDAAGVPVVKGPVRFRMNVAPEDLAMMEGQRYEVVYFLNGQLAYENELSYTPYTWKWTPQGATEGINYMTAVVVGLGRHFGVATVKFRIGAATGARLDR